MGKIIFWIVVVFALLFALRLWNAAKARSAKSKKPDAAVPEAMVQCSRCGVFLPRPDAQVVPEGYRCSDPACIGRTPGSR